MCRALLDLRAALSPSLLVVSGSELCQGEEISTGVGGPRQASVARAKLGTVDASPKPWEGEEPTQTACETFDSRVNRGLFKHGDPCFFLFAPEPVPC